MAIAQEFAGLDMEQLIGAPLRAAAGASSLLADSTANFINRIGFDDKGKVRTVVFGYYKRTVNEDGSSNLDEMKVDVPMLAIVPIPNLQVDEVNILFDMEVKQSEKQENSMDMSATASGSLNLGIIKVNVTGSVSAHQSNTRSSDNSAKYHVDVRATNHGIPEGLARVLDMMAANVAPMLVGSTLKDGNGQSLPEQARIKAQRLKDLRQEISQIETKYSAARDSLENNIQQLKRLASSQLNVYQGILTQKMNSQVDYDSQIKIASDQDKPGLTQKKEQQDKDIAAATQAMEEVSQSWNAFQNQAGDMIRLITDTGQPADGKVSDILSLKELARDENGQVMVSSYESGQSCYAGIASAQNKAVKSQATLDELEKELADKKAEYSDVISGKSQPALPAAPESGPPAP